MATGSGKTLIMKANIVDYLEYLRDKNPSQVEIIITSPMSELIMKEAGIKKGSSNSLKDKVAKITMDQVMKIVDLKIADLNTKDKEKAAQIVIGSCKSMGVEIA